VAVFAGGCFWCLESDFDKMPGVVATTSGFAGGHTANPSYDDVTSETTGHKEAVRVVYDTSKISYDQVLDYYWHHVDPTDDGGQFCDRGDSYRTGIFPVDDTQRAAAEASKKALDARHVLASPVVTQIVPGATFYAAENYHQDFHLTNPGRYEPYRMGCGRDAKVKSVWANETK
jgi:peptide-methionine (S)-S-oxide reductase